MSGRSSLLQLAALGGVALLCAPALAPAQAQVEGLAVRPVPQQPQSAGPSLSIQKGLPSPGVSAPPPRVARKEPVAARAQQEWSPIVVTTGSDKSKVRSGGLAPPPASEQDRPTTTGAAAPLVAPAASAPVAPEARPQLQDQAPIAAQPAPRSPEVTAPARTAPAAPAAPRPSETAPPSLGIAQQYCEAIADQAADARFAWQKKLIADMERELEKRTAHLEERIAEYQRWVARRDEFVAKATEGLVRIYGRMHAEAAAGQLSLLDEETAAAVINKLDAKVSSQILNEMESGKAARLMGIIAGAAKVATRTEKKP